MTAFISFFLPSSSICWKSCSKILRAPYFLPTQVFTIQGHGLIQESGLRRPHGTDALLKVSRSDAWECNICCLDYERKVE